MIEIKSWVHGNVILGLDNADLRNAKGTFILISELN